MQEWRRPALYLFFLAVLQASLSVWWLWISDGGGDQLVPKEIGYLLLVSGPAAWFAHGSVARVVFANSTFVLFALLIAAAFVHHGPTRVVLITCAMVWYAFCGVLPVLVLI
jgi:hypothetical protein